MIGTTILKIGKEISVKMNLKLATPHQLEIIGKNNRQKFTALDLTLLKYLCLYYSIEAESSETPQQFFMDFRGVLAISTKITIFEASCIMTVRANM